MPDNRSSLFFNGFNVNVKTLYIYFSPIDVVIFFTVGIVWHKDPNILFSCGKDSMIYQNRFDDAYRPAEHAPPVALGFSSTGNITFAKSDQLTAPEPKPKQYVCFIMFGPHFLFIKSLVLPANVKRRRLMKNKISMLISA